MSKKHFIVENGTPEIHLLAAAITGHYQFVDDDEMERTLLFDLDFDLIETTKVYEDSNGTIIKITKKHQEF